MLDKRCTKCGELSASNANFCSDCGAQEFAEASTEQLQEISPTQGAYAGSNALRLSVTRIVILSVVTSGVYVLYWLYLTWKQLQDETKDVHYPVWHALSFLVPIYQLFRIHKHIRVVQELALIAGIETSLTPGLAAVLVALYWVMFVTPTGMESSAVLLMLNFIRLALITTVIVWTQVTLNLYWRRMRGGALENVPIGRGEVRFVLLVLFIQLTVTFFVRQ